MTLSNKAPFEVTNWWTMSASILSLLTDLAVMYDTRRIKQKSVIVQLLSLMAMLDFCEQLTGITELWLPLGPTICYGVLTIATGGGLAALFIATLIPVICYYRLTRPINPQKFLNATVTICFLIALFITVLPLFSFFPISIQLEFDTFFGEDMCHYVSNTASKLSVVMYAGLPILMCILVNILYFCRVAAYLKQDTFISGGFDPRKLFLYPAAFIIAFLPTLIISIYLEFYSTESKTIVLITRVLDYSSGIITGCVYFFLLGTQNYNLSETYDKSGSISLSISMHTPYQGFLVDDDNGKQYRERNSRTESLEAALQLRN